MWGPFGQTKKRNKNVMPHRGGGGLRKRTKYSLADNFLKIRSFVPKNSALTGETDRYGNGRRPFPNAI